ncbi:hypothetical protein [Crateriforma conspicua]|uniref:Uncharacterized protein n=2 Tax=Crateriforma TaxID=2714592 RepID=A0A5C6FXH1_9PLAN|nr:hypothetical protein [Crateriforma conspicua]TWU67034.1 hypothetical protein V7x_26060 [Crateriforma conspicua]
MIGLRSNTMGWTAGDWAVYRKSKISSKPGLRAARVVATPKGESYNYLVDKYWVVEQVKPDGRLILRTPGGKRNVVDSDDPNLRRPSLWDRFLFRERFQFIEEQLQDQQDSSSDPS